MNEYGFVQLPIEEYNRLYDASKELEKLKKDMIVVTESYSHEPQFIVKAPLEIMQAKWELVKDKYPEYVFTAKRDEDQTVYGVISKKEPEVEL